MGRSFRYQHYHEYLRADQRAAEIKDGKLHGRDDFRLKGEGFVTEFVTRRIFEKKRNPVLMVPGTNIHIFVFTAGL